MKKMMMRSATKGAKQHEDRGNQFGEDKHRDDQSGDGYPKDQHGGEKNEDRKQNEVRDGENERG